MMQAPEIQDQKAIGIEVSVQQPAHAKCGRFGQATAESYDWQRQK